MQFEHKNLRETVTMLAENYGQEHILEALVLTCYNKAVMHEQRGRDLVQRQGEWTLQVLHNETANEWHRAGKAISDCAEHTAVVLVSKGAPGGLED